VFTNWLVPGEIVLPVKKRDCHAHNMNINMYWCTNIFVEQFLVDSSNVIQPFTDNNTRFCGAMLHYQLKLRWILIPCEQRFMYSLYICETTKEVVNAKTAIPAVITSIATTRPSLVIGVTSP